MGNNSFFEKIVASASLIARHAYFPGKEEAVLQCVQDVEDLLLTGRVTAGQGDVLREILSVSGSRAGLSSSNAMY